MESIPRIYAPISDRNDRITSLLSAVLMRKMRPASRLDFPFSLEIGATTVAIVLVTASTALQQLLLRLTQNTCLHLFVVDAATNANEYSYYESLNQLVDPGIPVLLVTDGPWLHSEKAITIFRSSRRSVWSIHFFPSSATAIRQCLHSRILVLTDEQQIVNSPDTICVIVSPKMIVSDVWKCRLILKYIQAMACIETNEQHSKL